MRSKFFPRCFEMEDEIIGESFIRCSVKIRGVQYLEMLESALIEELFTC